MAKRIILLIDDVPGTPYVVREAFRALQERYELDVDTVTAEVALPDAERARGYAHVPSLEAVLEARDGDVAACLVDCGFGSAGGLERSEELYHAARSGTPPFPEHFRHLPVAMFTARADVVEISQRLGCPVFPKISAGDVSVALVEWLANALGLS